MVTKDTPLRMDCFVVFGQAKWSKSAWNCTLCRLLAACFTQMWFGGEFPSARAIGLYGVWWNNNEITPRASSWQHLHRDSAAALQFSAENLFWWLVELSNLWWLPGLVFDSSNHAIIFILCMNWNFYAIYPNLCWHVLTSVLAIVE